MRWRWGAAFLRSCRSYVRTDPAAVPRGRPGLAPHRALKDAVPIWPCQGCEAASPLKAQLLAYLLSCTEPLIKPLVKVCATQPVESNGSPERVAGMCAHVQAMMCVYSAVLGWLLGKCRCA